MSTLKPRGTGRFSIATLTRLFGASSAFVLIALLFSPAKGDTVTYAGAGNQTWINNDADGDWAGGDNTFTNGDSVIFNNSGAGIVTITGSLQPSSVQFNNTVGNNFTFQTGNLNNGGNLTMSGGGNVTFTTVSMLPVLGDVTVSSGVLTFNNSERIGSLSGSGTLTGTAGNNVLRYGWNNSNTTFSGNIIQAAGGPGVPGFDKVGKGTTTITSVLTSLGSSAAVSDGTLRFVNSGALGNVGLSVYNGATVINDDTGTHVDDRTRATTVGGEYIVLGNASANSAIGGPNNTSFLLTLLGNPTLTLVPGTGFEAQYRQRNGGNNGTFSIGAGNTFLVRGDGLGQLSGTRSRLTIRTNELSLFMLGGAGATFSDAVGGNAGTPQVSVLYRTYVDSSSTGLGSGFATYDRGPANVLDDNDPGVRPLTASEYSSSLSNGDGAVVATIANTRLSSAIAGIDSSTRINSLILEQGGSISGSGQLIVHSGLIMSTGDNGVINNPTLNVPSVLQSGSFAGAASITHEQINLITPYFNDRLTINSNISANGSLVKTGEGTVILNGPNSYLGSTFVANGALRAIDGVGLPTNSTLYFTGGVFESSGTFSRTIGTGATNVRWDEFASGGFAAFGGVLNVQLNGGLSQVIWDNTANFVQGQRSLILGSASANNVVDFRNALSLGTFDAAANDRSDSLFRTIEVIDNVSSTTDLARISGNITGADARLQLQKIGNGTLELSGTNSYVGRTLVEAGTLLITGSSTNQGSYSIFEDATLGGTGIIGLSSTASVELADGAILSPGVNGGGTLTINGNLALNANSVLDYDLTTPNIVGGPNDLVTVNGNLILDGIIDISLSEVALGTYRLFNYTGSLTDNGLTLTTSDFLFLSLDLSTAGQVNLIVALPVPEPSSMFLLGFGLLALRRRKKTLPGQSA